MNPVYEHLREAVKAKADQLYEQWQNDKTKLIEGNRGVRCFMKRENILEQSEPFTSDKSMMYTLFIETGSAAEEVDPEFASDTLLALYSPSSKPYNTIRSGKPCELTDLALHSNLLWQLKSPPMHLSNTEQLCELFISTAFYLPNLQIDQSHCFLPDFCDKTTHLVLMSDLECVLRHLEKENRFVDLSNLMQIKLELPFLMAIRQNQYRISQGQEPFCHLVLGDLALRAHEPGVHALFAQRLADVLEKYRGLFKTITVCASPALAIHLKVMAQILNKGQ